MTEDIITSLSKLPDLFVVASNSTFTYKGQAVDVRRVGRYQGVRYVLEGSVRRAGDRLRITSQLIDATTGSHLWSERYDRTLGDIFALQDDITREVATAVQIKLITGDQNYVRGAGTQSFEAWELTIKGGRLIENHSREDMQTAQEILEKAVQVDPNYVNAWISLGWVHCLKAQHGWSASAEKSLETAWEMGERALALEPGLSSLLSLFAHIALRRGDHLAAEKHTYKALNCAGSQPSQYANAAWVLSCCGRPSEAIGHVERAMRLCPIYPNWYRAVLGRACLLAGDLDRAIITLQEWQEHDLEPAEPTLLATALYDNGQGEEAKTLVRNAMKAKPDFSISNWARKQNFKDPKDLAHMVAVLEELGVPK